MHGKNKRVHTPEMEVSFSNQNRQMDLQEDKLQVEILRVHTTQKIRMMGQIWRLQQPQLCQFFTKYQPFPAENFNIDQLLDSTNLKLIKNNGKIYFGQIVKQKRQGKGISVQEDKLYQGQFTQNQKNGYGVQIYSNGNLYIGEFFNNKKHGKGRFFWFNLTTKTKPNEKGVEYYDGDWWGGLPDGEGIHQKINGDAYIGTFKNSLKHGQGEEYFGNGDYYKGQYVNGLPQGFGEYAWKDGSMYKGDLKQGLRNGYGVWQLNKDSLETYRGHYQMDKKSGYGVYQWENGWSYKGNFRDDYRDGYGQLYDENQLMYRGYWEHGQQVQRQGNNRESYVEKEKYKDRDTDNDTENKKQKQSYRDRYHSKGTSSRASKTFEIGNKLKLSSKAQIQPPISFRTQFSIKKRPQSFTNLHKAHYEKPNPQIASRKQIPSISGSTIGSTIARPLIRTNFSNLYVPYRITKR